MATIIVNDETMTGKVGERLLSVARHNGAHIGFMCDNAGTCQGCRCQVLAGAENLNPPTEAELSWLPAERLAAGQRLACQAVIRNDGEVRVLSRAEELRRIVRSVITPFAGESRLTNLQPLLSIIGSQAADQLALFPQNVISNLRRTGLRRFAFPILDRERFFADIKRVRERQQ